MEFCPERFYLGRGLSSGVWSSGVLSSVVFSKMVLSGLGFVRWGLCRGILSSVALSAQETMTFKYFLSENHDKPVFTVQQLCFNHKRIRYGYDFF